jgi:uncharacterized membrane protein YeaQ/YmgE (transglycosylase-associated protein family)
MTDSDLWNSKTKRETRKSEQFEYSPALNFISANPQDQFMLVRYAFYVSPSRSQERSARWEHDSCEASRTIQLKRRRKKMVLGLVMASVLGTLWAWIVWIVVGGFAGALADRLVQGDKLGILGNIVIGIVGGLTGGAILGLFGIESDTIIWTFLTAFLGAVLLLWLINLITGGRGIGKRARDR